MDKIFNLENILFVGAILLALMLPAAIRRARQQGPQLTPAMLKAKLDNGEDVLLLDVRTPEEFTGELGHIKGAVLLPLAELPNRLTALGVQLADHKTTQVITICRTHNRSPKAAELLRKAGLANVAYLTGGMTSWNAQGLPVSKEAP
ncbi:MAG: rhodanese-like domain-containing protein [Rhodospirillales bacterium]|nr:rhodanese-like domain-containing protein [Rhodospirillales bacterium]